ncbi:YjcZ family sporulation protein [Paenibacillus terreus]|uniref:YjcZ family sporulation protein n=1 Tax=Paenibacillus terreus TaxID=1387834 RepID=A0ABV5B6I8_9BACL
MSHVKHHLHHPFTSTGAILVLFILLVIITRAWWI